MIHEFEIYLRSIRGYSENTISAYSKDLHIFARWARQANRQAAWSKVTRDDIDAFLQHQQAAGLSPATTNRQLAAISSLYNYFQRQGYEVANPCKYESRRKVAVKVPTTIPTSQLIEAYKHAQGAAKTMLGILATTGIRIQELLDIKFEDINVEDSSCIIKGKGAKERIVTIPSYILDDIISNSVSQEPSAHIFNLTQRAARHIIYQTLSPYCTARQLSPHAIRHTYATNLAKHGENVTTIAKSLGHSHIETSQKYIDMMQIQQPSMGINLLN